MTTKSLLRVNEAAELLQVSRWTVYRWLADGRLQGTKLGKGTLRILRDSVAQLIDENRVVLAAAEEQKPDSQPPWEANGTGAGLK